MRTLIKSLFITLLSILPLNGCMQNNGDIGDFFGTWKITSITVDGEPAAGYDGNIFIQFQTTVVRIVESKSHNDYTECFGSWESNGDNLTLDFHYYVSPENSEYHLPDVLGLEKAENHFVITESSSKSMSLLLTGTEKTVVYKLKKQ